MTNSSVDLVVVLREMKKLIGFSFVLALPIFIWIMAKPTTSEKISYISNPNLETISAPPEWKGTPIDEKERFVNLYHPFESSFADLLKWQTSKNPYKEEKESENRTLIVDFDPEDLLGEEDYMLWLGHATYLLRLSGQVILIDPILIDNTFLKRDSKLPFPIEELPPLDFIMISHNHRDHCDKQTIQFLSKQHPKAKFLTGLGLKKVIKSWTEGQEIQEAGWYQQYQIDKTAINITYVPSRHWSKRWLWDDNKSLWGGFYFQTPQQKIYFMGDSGKGPHFEDIKNTLGAPDFCLMGVGAFRPEWFMNQSHISPTDAIDAFNVMEGKFFIPMHFGTFDLSDEPRMEPWDILVEHSELIQGQLIEPMIGQNLLKSEGQ
ncbi:L-ascorbate metabolism protein UlaG (beta-lactamase superfamily) [Mongoliibacter ruber]|uniref:L-ascorbate metabolism protein UlaG (Beta-lactamase superfamily) n=1 Tax=Mongoliibacter ruber TaxID=1750599 RepID=A0A2T0WEP7_9BACT|nr:L-ascorbate metabolism protein UlaG (beta-lactamase superfamily) [Mongoliibacter ruber]